jgi:hypothetical protein
MRLSTLAAAALAFPFAVLRVSAAEDDGLTRMALCKDSWLDWHKSEPAKFQAFADHVRANFVPHGNDPFGVPKAEVSVLGLKVLEAYPDSVGMGVGFSLTVDATFDEARKRVEKVLGRALEHCEASEGSRDCGLEIAKQRNVMLMAEDKPGNHRTLIACYYFYEK